MKRGVIIAYACNHDLAGLELVQVSDKSNVVSVDTEDRLITSKIVKREPPSECVDTADAEIVIWLKSSSRPGETVYICGNKNCPSIEYPSGELSDGDYPVIKITTPEHCHWRGTTLKLYGPARCDEGGCLFAYTEPSSGGGEIPEEFIMVEGETEQEEPLALLASSTNEYFKQLLLPKKKEVFAGGENLEFEVTQNNVVPGMDVNCFHLFNSGIHQEECHGGYRYYTTPWLTGGMVMYVNGDYGDLEISYDVQCEGEILEYVRPSDWIEWEVGDWVFVDKQNNLIFPLKIGQDGD